ncbi:tetratricopeptide TPR_2 [Candidatus Moduliflexus flocculans]|uniref:Tetratricopeptide TPR_2 n=1 Tax=Candidatus Moduliflexus flocculans TaxID=1499966 RepID=A0A0S6VTD4_9BACT|nr:tetratricopeptide TPR_2 [Candidatus Moduliflexus flocculans]
MALPAKLKTKISNFLRSLPNIDDSNGRRAFIYSVGLDSQLQDHISFNQPVAEFIPLLIANLFDYGKLNDGRYALEALLETAKEHVGQDKKDYCERLIRELQPFLIDSERNKNIATVPLKPKFYQKALIVIILIAIAYYTYYKLQSIQGYKSEAGRVYITNTQGISDETFQNLAKELGVRDIALKSFFKILEQQQVPIEDLDQTLREIAKRYKELLAQVNILQSDDPEIQNLKSQAQHAIENGNFEEAEILFNQAITKNLDDAERLQDSVEGHLLSAAAIKATIGELKFTLLDYTESAKYAQQAIELLPKGHDEILSDYLNGLGYSLGLGGLYDQAETAFLQALTIRETLLGKEDPKVGQSLNNLAVLYGIQGRYHEAKALAERALEISKRIWGSEDPNVATSLNNLAELCYEQKQYDEAEQLYQQSLSIRTKVLGEEHSHVANSLNNLGLLYYVQGKYDMAAPLYQRALAIDEKILGKDHPDVADILDNLAALYEKQCKTNLAETLYKRALEIYETKLGKEHPSVANTLNNLGGLYYRQGKYKQAKPLIERALDIAHKRLPDDHHQLQIYEKNYKDLLSVFSE